MNVEGLFRLHAAWAAMLGLCIGVAPEAMAGPPKNARLREKSPRAPEVAAPASTMPGQEADTGGLYRPSQPMFRWEFPEILSEVNVPEEFETNGIPNRFRALVVALPVEAAYGFFRDTFLRQKLYVAPPHHQMTMADDQRALTGYDPERQISYTVFLTPYRDGTTSVIMGEAFFKGRQFAPGNPFVPVFAGAEGLVTQNLEAARSLAYRVKGNPVEVITFYTQVFRDRGYEKQQDGTWTRDASVLQLLVQPSGSAAGELEVAVVERFGSSDL